jgi:site-specific DNA recombinase
MLRSHTLLGQVEMTEEVAGPDGRKVKRTRLVRDSEGLPLQRAEPVISREQWDALQVALDGNRAPKAGNRYDRSPLLRVAYCTCGKALYRNMGRSHRYYRCAARAESGADCTESKAIQADLLEQTVEEAFLAAVGDLEIVRRVFKPGADHSSDIEAVTRALAELREDREAGLYSSEAGKKEYREAYLRMEAKREALLAMPVQPDGWEETPTGETYRERWERLPSSAERNAELREAGVRVVVQTEEHQEGSLLDALAEADPAMWSEEPPKGDWRQTFGRVEITLPRDFLSQIRRRTAVHQ